MTNKEALNVIFKNGLADAIRQQESALPEIAIDQHVELYNAVKKLSETHDVECRDFLDKITHRMEYHVDQIRRAARHNELAKQHLKEIEKKFFEIHADFFKEN